MTTDQMSFGFDTASHDALPTPAKAASKTKASKTRMLTTAAEALSHDAMAQALDAHPDYKVLRRLVPRDDWGAAPASGTQRVIVLDTETTGLDSRTESIIELAMLSVLVDTATGLPVGPVTIYESFEDPGKPIPPAIQDITGIDDTMVAGQRIDDAAVTALVEQADLIVAHNAGFDRPFVAPANIHWVKIDRVSGSKVFAGSPTDDPKSSIIWEAFKAESEARTGSTGGDAAKQRDALIAAIRKGAGQSVGEDSGAEAADSPPTASTAAGTAPRVP